MPPQQQLGGKGGIPPEQQAGGKAGVPEQMVVDKVGVPPQQQLGGKGGMPLGGTGAARAAYRCRRSSRSAARAVSHQMARAACRNNISSPARAAARRQVARAECRSSNR